MSHLIPINRHAIHVIAARSLDSHIHGAAQGGAAKYLGHSLLKPAGSQASKGSSWHGSKRICESWYGMRVVMVWQQANLENHKQAKGLHGMPDWRIQSTSLRAQLNWPCPRWHRAVRLNP
eukprot:1158590-Pelagomonas_calceolata.AAC.3